MKNKKTKTIITILQIVIIALAGIFCGNIIGNSLSNKLFPKSTFDITSYHTLKDNITYINFEGKKPTDLTNEQALAVATYKLETCTKYVDNSSCDMSISLGVKQYAESTIIRNGDNVNVTYRSFSPLIKVAGKLSYNINDVDNGIYITYGEPTDNTLKEIHWDKSPTLTNYYEYCNSIGRTPIERTTILSTKTIISSTVKQDNSNNYVYTVTLDPQKAGIGLRQEIAYRSGIDINTVKHKSLELEIAIDKNFNIQYEHLSEEYTLKYSGITVTVKSLHQDIYTY